MCSKFHFSQDQRPSRPSHSSAAIASASVTLLSPAKGIETTRQTDANGNYEFTNVQPGEYTISVKAAGFQKSETDRFTVTVGATIQYERRWYMGYVQDDFRFNNKLTFNLGLRYELVTPN
jgi:hypothetical protein